MPNVDKLCSQGLRHLAFLSVLQFGLPGAQADSLVETIKKIKPSIVAVGTHQITRRNSSKFTGTGFAIGDGRHVITNAHVISKNLKNESQERLTIFVGQGRNPKVVKAEVIAQDEKYDIAILRMTQGRLPAVLLGESEAVEEGQSVAFTGFPIGPVLGLHPVTHTGIVSAITPIVTPMPSARQLNPRLIRRMRDVYRVFQLDATAYPGNSGSPLFNPQTGEVVGIVNKVFVKESKEAVLQDPSAITYAIPIKYAKELLTRNDIVMKRD